MSKSRSVMSDDGFGAAHARKTLKSDAHKDSIDEKEELEEHAKKKVNTFLGEGDIRRFSTIRFPC